MSTEHELVAKCPQCGSVFRLTPQHLQAARGWVQCGMCGNVFHSGLMPPAEEAAAPTLEAEVPEKPVFEEAAISPTEALPQPENSAAAGAAEAGLSGLAQRLADEEGVPSVFGPRLESIILVDPNLPEADEDYGPMPEIAREAPPQAEKPLTQFTPAAQPGGAAARQATATSSGWIPRRPSPASSAQSPAKKKKPAPGWLWALLALLLVLALAVQLVYHLRDRLAAAQPSLRPQLAVMCEALGCTLSLPRPPRPEQLILGSNLQTENSGQMSLEITLVNRAAYAIAWPVLELTLTDVEDEPLARRMFAPSEYLPTGKMEAEGIQAQSEIPFLLQLHNKGLKAAGYRLRLFY